MQLHLNLISSTKNLISKKVIFTGINRSGPNSLRDQTVKFCILKKYGPNKILLPTKG